MKQGIIVASKEEGGGVKVCEARHMWQVKRGRRE